MFPRLTLLYRLLAVCILVSVIMFLLQTADDRVHNKRLPFVRDYISETIREPESNGESKTAGSISKFEATARLQSSTKQQTSSIAPVNPHNFHYIINPKETCSGKKIKFIVYVHSAPKNHKKRQMVRQTWGARSVLQKYKMRVVFIMGVVSDKVTMEAVKLESNTYGDIVVESFLDSYRNLTYKAIGGLKWVSKHCDNVTYVIKSDDDILIDMHALMAQMNSTEIKSYGTQNLIMCNQWVRMKVIRDKKSKWYISKEEFPDDFFPPYCSGSIFIMSIDAVKKLYVASLQTQFFWVDDFYLTGLLVKKIGIEHKRLNDNYMLNARVAMEKLKEDKKHELRFFHVHKLTQIYRMWSMLNERKNSTCNECLSSTPSKNASSPA